eukprot:m.244835 g.244835  ORF g.244835 m.244835 type:complete len:565 (-) comp22564_c5_seq3:90-1784(-)
MDDESLACWIDPHALQQLLTGDGPQPCVLDLRSVAQFQQGHLRGALSVSLSPLLLRRLRRSTPGCATAPHPLLKGVWKEMQSKTVIVYSEGDVDIPADVFQALVVKGGFSAILKTMPELCEMAPAERGLLLSTATTAARTLSAPASPVASPRQGFLLTLPGCQSAAPSFGLAPLEPGCSSRSSRRSRRSSSSSRSSACESDNMAGALKQEPSRITSFLVLGSEKDVQPVHMEQHQITHILSLTPQPPDLTQCPSVAHTLHVPLSDDCNQDIDQPLQVCIDFIEKCRSDRGRVFVHCYAGMSRAPTVVIGYLMSVLGMPFPDALAHVQKQRIIAPNLGFLYQLQKLQPASAPPSSMTFSEFPAFSSPQPFFAPPSSALSPPQPPQQHPHPHPHPHQRRSRSTAAGGIPPLMEEDDGSEMDIEGPAAHAAAAAPASVTPANQTPTGVNPGSSRCETTVPPSGSSQPFSGSSQAGRLLAFSFEPTRRCCSAPVSAQPPQFFLTLPRTALSTTVISAVSSPSAPHSSSSSSGLHPLFHNRANTGPDFHHHHHSPSPSQLSPASRVTVN